MHTGKHNHKCKDCGRAFVLVPENHIITKEQRAMIERLLRERISLRGICRANSNSSLHNILMVTQRLAEDMWWY
jgi:insertion element IS1 protein InsB